MSTIQAPKGRSNTFLQDPQPVVATPQPATAAPTPAPRQTGVYAEHTGLPTPTAEPSALSVGGGGKAASSSMDVRMGEVSGAAKTHVANLDPAQLGQVATKKATCPFIGSAVAQGLLPVRNNAEVPLASISDVAALGNSGGGDLGEVLKLFAKGNHSRMPTPGQEQGALTPSGHFSLDFPGSQGSHPGHSGILQGDPTQLNTGRLSQPDLDRLLSRARHGVITQSDLGKYIAENLAADPNAKVFGARVTGLLLGDVASTLVATGPALLESLKTAFGGARETTQNTRLYEALTKTLGEDNLVGSAGEFGLLMAMLANSPRSRMVDGEPAISVEDVRSMFVDHKFPDGWETWPKSRHDWVVASTQLTLEAAKEYLALKH